MQQDVARDSIVKTCLKLAVNGEARLDKNVVHSAFRPWPGRDSEEQLVTHLRGVSDGVFLCRRLANGDLLVTRSEVGKPSVMPEPAAAPSTTTVAPSKATATGPGKKKRRRKPRKRH